jgi:hypothetical protein
VIARDRRDRGDRKSKTLPADERGYTLLKQWLSRMIET